MVTPLVNIIETTTSDDERDRLVWANAGNRDVTVSTQSDVGPESVGHIFDERIAKSDNFSESQASTTKFLDVTNKSPSLPRKIRTSLRSRFSFDRKRSRSHQTTTAALTVPLLHPQREARKEERSKVRSRTSGPFEERYVKPRERGRGSFVIVKIKDPGPVGFLGQEYVKKLEENFRLNHLFGSLAVDVEEKMKNMIRQGQVSRS